MKYNSLLTVTELIFVVCFEEIVIFGYCAFIFYQPPKKRFFIFFFFRIFVLELRFVKQTKQSKILPEKKRKVKDFLTFYYFQSLIILICLLHLFHHVDR
jgi:hypothetical protein